MEGLAGTGFTAEDIDTLIVEAREKASGAEWSSQAWRHGDSHEETEFKLHHFEGGQQNAQAGSQEFHLHVQRRVDECLSSADGVIKVGSLGSLVVDALSMLEKPSCRPRSTTGKGDLFPLPVAHFSHHPESHSATSSEDLRCFFTCSGLLQPGPSSWPSERRRLGVWYPQVKILRDGFWLVEFCQWGTSTAWR